MFACLIRLICSVLLAITPVVTSAPPVLSNEQPAQSVAAQARLEHTAGAAPNQLNAAGRPAAYGTWRVSAQERLSSPALRPDFRPLTAGVPQTITVQVVPNTLIANSGMTAAITATVYDITGDVVDGADLTGSVTAGRGSVGSFPLTDLGGTTTSTWTAAAGSTTVGTGVIQVITDTASGSAPITLTAGSPFTVTLLANPTNLPVGSSSTLTATVVDQYQNLVADGTIVTFTSDITSTVSSRTTTNGLATFSITSTLVGTAHITATSGTASDSAAVVFIPGVPFTVTLLANPASLTVGNSSALTATVIDRYSNPVANGTTVNFATDRGTVLSPRTTTSGLATSAITSTTAGTAHITATSGTASDSATAIFIPDVPFTVTLLANPASLTVGNSSALTATVVDRYSNLVANGTTVNFATDRGTVLSPRTTTNGIATSSVNSTLAGTAHITATSAGRSDFESVVFNPGAPSTLTLQPPTAVISAGQRITFTAIATDSFGNSIGNVTGSTAFSIAPASGGSFVANAVTPTVKSTWIVTGINGSAVDTSSLTVTSAAFNRLAIEDAPAGSGSAIGAVTLNIYSTLTAYAAAYDAYNNLIGARSVGWGGTGVVNGRLGPLSGVSTTFTPAISGTGTITAASGSVTDTTGIITVQAPVLRISKTASPNPLTPGSPLQYTILYTNTGNAAAQNVIITETYPISASFFSASPDATSGNNVWSIGSLAVNDPHSIVVFMTTPSQMPIGTVLTNSVSMGGAKVASAFYTTTTPVNALPNLSASMTDSQDPVRPGALFYYVIQYRNDGTAPVHNVRITETYPAQVSYVSAIPSPDFGQNVWLTSTLNGNGDSRTIVVTVRVNSPLADTTILNNRVVVAAQDAPPYTTTQQTLVIAPELQLTKSAEPPAPRANSLLTYTLTYTNNGSDYAASAAITDVLPAKTSFVQCQPVTDCVPGSKVRWNLDQIDSGASGTVTLTVRLDNDLPNGTLITNTANIASAEQATATAQLISTVISAPDVTLSKSDGISQIAAGQTATYTLNYANAGTAPAANVVITDRIPDYTTFVGCSSCVTTGGGVYSFTLGTLSAGHGGAVTIRVRLASTLPAGLRAITNTAAIATTTGGDAPGNSWTQDVDGVSTRPTLALVPTFDTRTPYPGKVITYTLRYTNTSAMDTIGVVITATRSAGLTGTPPGWTKVGPSDVRSIGNLAAGQSGSVTYVLTLPLTYSPNMRAFTVTFTIRDSGPGGLPPAQDQKTPLLGVPDLSIARVIIPAVAAGQKFTATVIVKNDGLGLASNPKTGGGFYVDAFVDPATPPPSYPFKEYGDPYAWTPPLTAGLTATVFISNIQFAANQDHILYFKVDNYSCSGTTCLPVGSKGGVVPEYNEYNNVSPAPGMYLPLILKNSH
jgi:uncharacterized repeat protein (TIGR01451 family)